MKIRKRSLSLLLALLLCLTLLPAALAEAEAEPAEEPAEEPFEEAVEEAAEEPAEEAVEEAAEEPAEESVEEPEEEPVEEPEPAPAQDGYIYTEVGIVVKAPEVGATVGSSYLADTHDSGVKATIFAWVDLEDTETYLPDSYVFKAGKAYRPLISVKTVNKDDSLGYTTKYTVNGTENTGYVEWGGSSSRLWAAPAFTPVTPITEVGLTVDAPAAGAAPSTTVKTASSKYKIYEYDATDSVTGFVYTKGVCWWDNTTGRVMEAGETFKAGHSYTISVIVQRVGDNVFGSTSTKRVSANENTLKGVSVTVNGREAWPTGTYEFVNDYYVTRFNIDYTFTKLPSPTVIDSVSVTVPGEVYAGEKIPFKLTVPADSGYSIDTTYNKSPFVNGVVWYNGKSTYYKEGDVFEAGKEYYLVVRLKCDSTHTFKPADTYTFDGSLIINGKSFTESSEKVFKVGNATSDNTAANFTNNSVIKVAARPVAVTGVTLDKSSILMRVGDSVGLWATVAPEDATDKTLTWVSDNEAVVTVDKDGVITGVGVGSAIITATSQNGKTGICAVEVWEAESGHTVSGRAAVWTDAAEYGEFLLYNAAADDAKIRREWQNSEFSTSPDVIAVGTYDALADETVDGKSMKVQAFSFTNVADGSYKLAIFKEGKYVPKIIPVTVSGGDLDVGTVKLWLYGDVDYNGELSSVDVLQINRHMAGLGSVFNNGTEQEKAEREAAANVTAVSAGDTELSSVDVLQINRYMAGLASVFNNIK